MQTQNTQVNLPTSVQNVDASKASSAAGGGLSCLAALLVLITFIMPWALFGAYKISGMEFAAGSGPVSMSSQYHGSPLLYLVPLIALAVVVVALFSVAATFVVKNQLPSVASSGCVSLLGLAGILMSCVFFAGIQAAKRSPNSMATGGLIQLEPGYWGTVVGFLLVVVGGGIGVAGLFLRRILSKPARDI